MGHTRKLQRSLLLTARARATKTTCTRTAWRVWRTGEKSTCGTTTEFVHVDACSCTPSPRIIKGGGARRQTVVKCPKCTVKVATRTISTMSAPTCIGHDPDGQDQHRARSRSKCACLMELNLCSRPSIRAKHERANEIGSSPRICRRKREDHVGVTPRQCQLDQNPRLAL